jgi:galactose mutarotase-like enzyme
VTTTATNFGDTPCPYGHGQHPYLSPGTTQTHNNANHNNANHNNANHNNSNHNNATHNNANHNNANHDNGNHTSGNHDSGDGDGVIDDCSLQLDAARVLMLDDRGLPTRSDYVIGSHFDFRHPRRLGDTLIDNIYTELARDTAGRAWVHLRGPHEPNGPDGCTVSLWMDHHYRYVALYTGDTHPPEHHRGGLGVAPMTCGPNGFATGEHLIVLEPGQSVSTQWGIHTRDTASTDPR